MKPFVFTLSNPGIYLFTLLLCMMAACTGPEKEPEKDIYSSLELKGKINTFPLCIVLSDKLSGQDFPADLKAICSFSKGKCKTLPIAGILRSGADIYYTYNCFADLKIPGSAGKSEGGITEAVEEQVAAYYTHTNLKEYDSLLTPNQPEWNLKNVPATYIGNTSDSVFFYSNRPGYPASIQVGYRTFPVYSNVTDLRKEIDNIICRGYEKIAVFYNPVAGDSTLTTNSVTYTARGRRSGDTCVQYARYEKLHNGSGGFMLGRLLQARSRDCGFTEPPMVSPDPVKKAALPPAVSNPAPAKPAPAAGDDPVSLRQDNQCARRGEPVCEQDESKNFTGRRVQYCYNKAGKIIRTIVVSKCEADCRCF